jgi:hypothetical protein
MRDVALLNMDDLLSHSQFLPLLPAALYGIWNSKYFLEVLVLQKYSNTL